MKAYNNHIKNTRAKKITILNSHYFAVILAIFDSVFYKIITIHSFIYFLNKLLILES